MFFYTEKKKVKHTLATIQSIIKIVYVDTTTSEQYFNQYTTFLRDNQLVFIDSSIFDYFNKYVKITLDNYKNKV